jgi:hypothetical protein
MAVLPGEGPGSFCGPSTGPSRSVPTRSGFTPQSSLRDTPPAESFREGRYAPLALEAAIEQCREALKRLTAAGIPVIRLGQQTTRELEQRGPSLPAPSTPPSGPWSSPPS